MKDSSSVKKKIQSTSGLREKVSRTRVVKRGIEKQSAQLKKLCKHLVRRALLSSSFQYSIKVIGISGVIISSVYGAYHFAGKTFANEVVISKSEIVSRVSKLTTIPEESPYDVVRVEDDVNLQRQNLFYKDVKEGDYILMYKDMVIIYDLRSNVIVAMRKNTKSPLLIEDSTVTRINEAEKIDKKTVEVGR